MNRFEAINEMLTQHTQLMQNLSHEIEQIKSNDVYAQNENLRTTLATTEQRLGEAAEKAAKLDAENKRLKNELYEQLFNEKAKLVNTADGRLSAYFRSHEQKGQNRLSQFEWNMKKQIDQLSTQLSQNQTEVENAVYQRLQDLRSQVGEAVEAAHKKAVQEHAQLLHNKEKGMAELRAEPLTEEQMLARSKQNNIESFFGLKIFNKLGIFLIVVGVISAVQFSFAHISNPLKGVLAFSLGALMLALGELMNRRRPDVFSLGLTAGGIAVLYSSTALSFFLLHILSMYAALLLCILITALAFVLSQRYNAQTIAAFAVVGGYLPIFSIGGEGALVYYAMGYFLLLNGFSLLVSVYKKWRTSQFMGFFLNLIANVYILSLLHDASSASAKFFALGYTFLSFVVYTAIPLLSSYRTEIRLRKADNVLLILNTFLGSLMMFWVFRAFGLWNRAGLMSIAFCLFYLLAAKIMRRKLSSETTCRVLFYITGLTFAVLAVPIQLDIAYVSLGWLIQGTFLLCYGIWKERKSFSRAGTVIFSLCLFLFLTLDLLLDSMVFYKYFFITLASMLILAVLLRKQRANAGGGRLYKAATLVNGWFFLLFTCYDKLFPLLHGAVESSSLARHFMLLTSILLSICYAYLIARLKALTDRTVRWISSVIYAFSILWLLTFNAGNAGIYLAEHSMAISVLGTLLVLAVNLLAVFAVRDLMLRLTLAGKLGPEWYPLILSAFFVFVFTQNLIVVFDLSLNNILVTAVLAATALGWILFGFAKRYLYIRLSGLGLSFLTVVKLFLIDLSFLTEGMRIVSYFLMGAALLAISFVYQHFNRKLDSGSAGDSL